MKAFATAGGGDGGHSLLAGWVVLAERIHHHGIRSAQARNRATIACTASGDNAVLTSVARAGATDRQRPTNPTATRRRE